MLEIPSPSVSFRLVTVIVSMLLANSLNDAHGRHVGPSHHTRTHAVTKKAQPIRVVASWYGDYFHGRRMANGKPFDKRAHTVAQNTFHLGTRVKITNPENHRIVTAVVTDRGGFEKYGRGIDVSEAIAAILGFRRKGVTELHVQVVYEPDRDITYHHLNKS